MQRIQILLALAPNSIFFSANHLETNTPPIGLTLVMLGFCCIFLLILGVIVLGFFVRNQNRKESNNAKSSPAEDPRDRLS